MRAKFTRAGMYAHVNDPISKQFHVSEEEAKDGKVIDGLSEETVRVYTGTGACQALDDPEEAAAEAEADEETEEEEKPRKRGRRKGR